MTALLTSILLSLFPFIGAQVFIEHGLGPELFRSMNESVLEEGGLWKGGFAGGRTSMGRKCVPVKRKSRELTLVTYNVGAMGKYMEDSSGDISKIIEESGASLVSLNELDSCNARHGDYQLEKLSGLCDGADFHFAGAFPFAGGSYGNGVLSKEKILRRAIIPLPKFDGYEPRSVAVAETADCVFASVHLDVASGDAALLQAEMINRWFEENYSGYGKPVILAGDMNSVPGSDVIERLSQRWTIISPAKPTYPSSGADRCIDYIMYMKDAVPVKTVLAEVISSSKVADVQKASDHLPVRVRILWQKK